MGFTVESFKIREIALETDAFEWLKGLFFSFKNIEDLFDRAKFNSILMHLNKLGWNFNPIPSFFDKSLFCFRIGPAYVVIPKNTRNKQLVVLNKAYLQEIFKHDGYLLSDEFFEDLRKDLGEPLPLNLLAEEKKPCEKKEENKEVRQHLDQVERVLGAEFAEILASMVLNAQISGQDAFNEVNKLGPLTSKILKEYFEGKYDRK